MRDSHELRIPEISAKEPTLVVITDELVNPATGDRSAGKSFFFVKKACRIVPTGMINAEEFAFNYVIIIAVSLELATPIP